MIMDFLASIISENASFFSTYGNWIFIPLLFIVIFIDNKLAKSAFSHKLIKWSLKSAFVITAFGLGALIYMINFPLKPMINSISTVETNIGQQIYDFDFIDVRTGHLFSISDFQGKLIILNFWGTYCRPCLEEFPDLRKIESTYPNEVSVIALSDESEDKIVNFIQKITSPTVVGSFSSDKWIELESFRPLTIIIDKNGIVREYVFGKRDYNFFKSAVEEYL